MTPAAWQIVRTLIIATAVSGTIVMGFYFLTIATLEERAITSKFDAACISSGGSLIPLEYGRRLCISSAATVKQ